MIKIKRVYDPVSADDGKRILIDRLQGISKPLETFQVKRNCAGVPAGCFQMNKEVVDPPVKSGFSPLNRWVINWCMGRSPKKSPYLYLLLWNLMVKRPWYENSLDASRVGPLSTK